MHFVRRGSRLAVFLGGAAVIAAGCDLLTYRPPVGRDFGAPYAVRAGVPIQIAPGRVLETPALDEIFRMYTVVEYEGGCLPHTFALASDAGDSERTLLWLIHDDGGDRCTELVRDTVVVELGSAYRPGAMALETPAGDHLPLRDPDGGG